MSVLALLVSCVIAVLLFAVCTATLWWMIHAWQSPEAFESVDFATSSSPWLSFSIIMPCRDEPLAVMEPTLDRLLGQTHLAVEVILSVGDDDPATVAVAHALAARNPDRVRVSINHDPVKNKPRQLNTALPMCRGDVVGIMDAESLAHPELIERVDATFQQRGADVVQGAVHLMNYRSRWFSLRNCLEYRIWFRSRLHGHAGSGFIPLGGNTVFVYRELLEQVGGWDGDCLAEDCEIGVRLSALGKRVVCGYEAELTTLEEAPTTVKSFVKQRTRWALGFMQVLAKGEWRSLPTRGQQLRGWWTLAQQYAMAFAGVAVPIGFVSALFLHIPTPLAMLTYLPVMPMVLTMGFEMLVLREFGRDMRLKIGLRDYATLVLSTPFYQALLAFSAINAVFKFWRGDFGWDKTRHSGAHLSVVRLADAA